MIKAPATISSREILVLLNKGSNIAVNNVIDERQTRAIETVESLMEKKNNIQWAPSKAPVNIIFISVARLILKAVLLKLKYRNNDAEAISTLYQTNGTAEMVINCPNMPVNPQMKTVRWSITRFLLGLSGICDFLVII